MAKCEFCDKGVTFGIKVSHSHRRSNRPWKPNVKRVKAMINGTPRHVYVCTRCLRSGKVTRAIYARTNKTDPMPCGTGSFFFRQEGGTQRPAFCHAVMPSGSAGPPEEWSNTCCPACRRGW